MKKILIIALLFTVSCATQYSDIPEPPSPTDVFYESVKNVEWHTDTKVVYNYGCSAGDMKASFTLEYTGDWAVASVDWQPALCPER